MAIGQKMSGGLHACMTANRPRRRAFSVSHAVARNEYAYSVMKLTLLPPGAYGRYLYSSHRVDRPRTTGSSLPFGHTTDTSYPAATSAWHSSHTRRSKGTGRFWTMMRIVSGGLPAPPRPRLTSLFSSSYPPLSCRHLTRQNQLSGTHNIIRLIIYTCHE